MIRCEQCNEMMSEALYGELDAARSAAFEKHIAECKACASSFSDVRETLDVMSRRTRRDPGSAYWDGYWDRLQERMQGAEPSAAQPVLGSEDASWWRRRVGGATHQRWAYRTVAAAAILVIGVFAGRAFFPSPQQIGETEPRVSTTTTAPRVDQPQGGITEPTNEDVATGPRPRGAIDVVDTPGEAPQAGDGQPGDVQLASSDERAMCYVEKSQLLLLALVNSEPDEDGFTTEIGMHQSRSKALLSEAVAIKSELNTPRQRRLRELVVELEKILREIANIESEQDSEAVEFIRSRVDKRDMMLKINLEQLRYGEEDEACRPGTLSAPVDTNEEKRSI